MFSLSVCLIVKNEEKVLGRCLECCKKFADEIVVVDTGSTDSTVKIAKHFTDKIFQYQWDDNFSNARNFSFSKATKDYIMWLDADDFITDKNIEKIKKLKTTSEPVDVFMCKYLMDFDEENRARFTFYRERILKRSKNFKWEGFIHEVITPSGNIAYTDIEIQHRKPKDNIDASRNLKIYKKALKSKKKLSAREQYYYARELYYHHKHKQCIKEMKRYLRMGDTYKYNLIGANSILAECFLALSNPNEALSACFAAIKISPTPELCCLTARCYEKVGNKDLAIFWYKSALEAPQEKGGFVKEEYKKLTPCIALTKLYFDKGEVNKSLHYHNLAATENPKHPAVVYNETFFKNYLKK